MIVADPIRVVLSTIIGSGSVALYNDYEAMWISPSEQEEYYDVQIQREQNSVYLRNLPLCAWQEDVDSIEDQLREFINEKTVLRFD